MQMKEIQREILANKKRHGFNTTNIEQEFCYLYGEVRESYEAYCEGWDTFGEELADVTNFLMGIAEIKGIDLATEILKRVSQKRTSVASQKEGIVLYPRGIVADNLEQMKQLQSEVFEKQVLQGGDATNMALKFCDLYGKIGEAYEAYYKGFTNFPEKLAEVALSVMQIAETSDIDLGAEIVKKVNKNKNRVYKKNELGYMVHL